MSKISRSLGFVAVVTGTALNFLDQTILPVALPTIQQELLASATALQWTINAYLLTLAIFVLLGGKINDSIGHKKGFLIGMVLFTFSSALCGFSPSIGWLIGSRALQGIGAGIMFPSLSTLLSLLFPVHQRGRANGLLVSIGTLFALLGPVVGGFLTEIGSWRAIFWVNLPIAGLGFVIGLFYLPVVAPNRRPIDWLGFLFFALALAPIIVLLMQASAWGYLSIKNIPLALIGLIATLALIQRNKRAKYPILELSLFKHPLYGAITLSVCTAQFIMMISVFQILYWETVLDYTREQAGLIVSACTIPVLLSSNLGGYLSDKVSHKLALACGYLFVLFSLFWFSFHSTPSLLEIITGLLSYSMGIPLILTPSFSRALATLPASRLGAGFSMLISFRMCAATLGLAMIHLFTNTVQRIETPKVGQKEAILLSFSFVHLALAFLVLIAFALTFFLHQRKSEHELPPSPAEGYD